MNDKKYKKELEKLKQSTDRSLFVSKSLRDDRFEKCFSCPEYNKSAIVNYCNKCLCVMAIKTWLKESKCPINQW